MTNLRPLPLELQEIAVRDLNEVPELIDERLAELRAWIEKQPHLKARTDDQFLVAFLRGCKYNMEKAKAKVDCYYTLKTKQPNFYTIHNMEFSRALDIVRLGVGLKLPTPLNDNGQRIALIRTGSYPTDKYTFEDVMCVANSLQELTIRNDDYAVVNGYLDILDMAQVTGSHFLQITPGNIKKMSTFAEEAVPMPQGTTHFINAPSAFYAVFAGLSFFMPAKQKAKIRVHSSTLEEFYKSVPQKYLPSDYGGENSSVAELTAETEKLFLQYRDYFAEDVNYGVDEKLRPNKMDYN